MPHAEVTLPGVASSVPIARHFVESVLSSWHQPELAWTATLIVSELGANCALHARTEFTVRVSGGPDGPVRLEVSDGSVRLPRQRAFGLESTTGRGLRLVDELASEWGVDAREDGKTLWVVLAQPPGAGDEQDHEDVDLDALLAAFDGDDELAGPAPRPGGAEQGALRVLRPYAGSRRPRAVALVALVPALSRVPAVPLAVAA